jgi:uncharacterized protein (TIGR02598 family)
MNQPRLTESGFSLIEVSMALAISAFCFVTLLALVPLDIQRDQNSDAMSRMSNLASSIARDLETTPTSTGTAISPVYLFSISPAGGSAGNASQTLFLDAGGTPTGTINSSATASSIYRVSVSITPPPVGTTMATLARLVITFPAQAAPFPGTQPNALTYSTMFETTISLNRN